MGAGINTGMFRYPLGKKNPVRIYLSNTCGLLCVVVGPRFFVVLDSFACGLSFAFVTIVHSVPLSDQQMLIHTLCYV
jgi:hypothetical protein